MAQDERAEALAEINVIFAFDRGQDGALRAAKEDRRATHAFERADWTVYASGREVLCALEELFVECAGRAKRRRRFGCFRTTHDVLSDWTIQSGVAVPTSRDSATALQIKFPTSARIARRT